jgi:hypothetical protein
MLVIIAIGLLSAVTYLVGTFVLPKQSCDYFLQKPAESSAILPYILLGLNSRNFYFFRSF